MWYLRKRAESKAEKCSAEGGGQDKRGQKCKKETTNVVSGVKTSLYDKGVQLSTWAKGEKSKRQ